jgi:hypothetical protein
VVLVVSQHNFPKPGTDLGRAMMLPALKLSLNGFKLRDHPLLRRNPPNDESSAAVELPTEMSETQEREGFWFCFPTIFRSKSLVCSKLFFPCNLTDSACRLIEESGNYLCAA